MWIHGFVLTVTGHKCRCKKVVYLKKNFLILRRETSWSSAKFTTRKAAQPAAREQHAAPEVVLSGPRCNKFVIRLYKFLVFFIGSSIFAIKTHQNYTCCFCYGPTTQKLV